MPDEPMHRWDLDPAAARALQVELAARVDTSTPPGAFETVAAADVSFDRGSPILFAAVVVWEVASGAILERAGVVDRASFPYVPGLLSFREAPAILRAFSMLKLRPDLALCDGQGTAHPRRLGVASHIGLWLDVPTVGVAKSRLCGTHAEPGPERGDRAPLVDKGEVIGDVLRTRRGVKPLYVSPGHRVDREGAVAAVMACLGKYRLPIPSRLAHEAVNELRREAKAGSRA